MTGVKLGRCLQRSAQVFLFCNHAGRDYITSNITVRKPSPGHGKTSPSALLPSVGSVLCSPMAHVLLSDHAGNNFNRKLCMYSPGRGGTWHWRVCNIKHGDVSVLPKSRSALTRKQWKVLMCWKCLSVTCSPGHVVLQLWGFGSATCREWKGCQPLLATNKSKLH